MVRIANTNRFGETILGTFYMGGVLIPICPQWPRTDVVALSPIHRTSHDVNSDGIADVVLTTRAKPMDTDGDGVADAIHLRVAAGEAIHHDGNLECGETERTDAIRRVVQQI